MMDYFPELLFTLIFVLAIVAVLRLWPRTRAAYLTWLRALIGKNAIITVVFFDVVIALALWFGVFVVELVVFDQFSQLEGTGILAVGGVAGIAAYRKLKADADRLGVEGGALKREISLVAGGFLGLVGLLVLLGPVTG